MVAEQLEVVEVVRVTMCSTVKFWNGKWWPHPAHLPSCLP